MTVQNLHPRGQISATASVCGLPATARTGPLLSAHCRGRVAELEHSFVLDGETVLLNADGHSDFNGLHSRKYDAEVEFYAFDCLTRDGDDIRSLPLHLRKAKLARLLARRVDGIHPASFEQGEIGPSLFQHARLLRLEGLVSKHRESVYRGGRSDRWIKVKNRSPPAFSISAPAAASW